MLSETVAGFRERITQKTAERWGNGADWPFTDWPLDRVLDIYMQVNQMLGENDDRISEKWFEDVAALARVILSERSHASAVERFNSNA